MFRNGILRLRRKSPRIVTERPECIFKATRRLAHSRTRKTRPGRRILVAEGDNRTLKDFVTEKRAPNAHGKVTDTERRENGEVHFDTESIRGDGKSFFIQTYGCQMNVSDTEIVRSVLEGAGYDYAASLEEANVVLLNTCAIREKAETRIWGRLAELKGQNLKRKKADKQTVGLLGCMAERLKEKVLDKSEVVDVVAGPDAYRDLPHLLAAVSGEDRAAAAVNVQLSVEETYGDIAPVRDSHSSVSAFTSIQRGCNNMCAFCIVPFTRGRERSRALDSIVAEVESLSNQGYREVTLLGQNVNSYFDRTRPSSAFANADPLSSCSVDSPARGFVNMYKLRDGDGYRFGDLLRAVAEINPEMRVRFTSPHPKDFQDDVLDAIASYSNICKGSTRMLRRMRRGHDRDAYLELIRHIRDVVGPQVRFSSDFISGFCGETEEDHLDTISLLEEVCYDQAFMFAYSLRARTHAAHKMKDDVPPEEKGRRLSEVISTFRRVAENYSSVHDKNLVSLVLVEDESKRSTDARVEWTGKGEGHKRVVFPARGVPPSANSFQRDRHVDEVELRPGDFVAVHITGTGTTTLQGTPLFKTSIGEFAGLGESLRRGKGPTSTGLYSNGGAVYYSNEGPRH